MLDYLKWTQRARAFVRGLALLPGKIELHDCVEAPGKKDSDKRTWLGSRKCSLPAEIREFVKSASQWCIFQYRWSPPAAWLQRLHAFSPGRETVTGGADLCEANRYFLYDGRDEFQALFDSLPVPAGFTEHILGFTKKQGRFLRLAPLERERELVLELESPDRVRGVGCALSADGTGFQRLSTDFDMFLTHWEAICYVTPDPETLAPWLDPATGLLQPDPEKSRAFRTMFREAAGS